MLRVRVATIGNPDSLSTLMERLMLVPCGKQGQAYKVDVTDMAILAVEILSLYLYLIFSLSDRPPTITSHLIQGIEQ